ETGTTYRAAAYTAGSGTPTLVFDYVVQAGDVSDDLDYASSAALELAGGAITDAAGNPAVLTLAEPGEPGSLAALKSIALDSIAPTDIKVSSPKATGVYGPDTNIRIRVTFSEP